MTEFLTPSPLLTDLYQLTMLQSYLDHGLDDVADFEFFVRDLPETRNFLVAAGLDKVLDFLENLRFSKHELQWLSEQEQFNQNLIDYLGNLKFEGNVHAMPEGTIFFPGEPILRVSAPIPQAQLVETRIINLLHFQTMITSKAVRSVIAAKDKVLVDFGLRRAHGAESGLYAARSSYIAGFSGTSTVLAGQLFNIPLYGTMAHSFIQAHDNEETAFEHFARSQPNNVVLLLDTFDVFKALDKTITLIEKLKKDNIQIDAVRLDSGDLIEISGKIRKILDSRGYPDVKIFASGNLDEYMLQRFSETNAPIDGFGVGTLMITSADAPYLECGYKLVQYAGSPRYKNSTRKQSWPYRKQVYRHYNADGSFAFDELTIEDDIRQGIPLLEQVMSAGKRTKSGKSLSDIRNFVKNQLDHLPPDLLCLDKMSKYPVKISEKLQQYSDKKILRQATNWKAE